MKTSVLRSAVLLTEAPSWSSPTRTLREVSQLVLPGTAADYSAFAVRLAIRNSKSKVHSLGSKVVRETAMPNTSIERTCPGKPGHASHVKR